MSSDHTFCFPPGKPDELWAAFSTDDTDETVFSILNYDHDQFLLELDMLTRKREDTIGNEDQPNLTGDSSGPMFSNSAHFDDPIYPQYESSTPKSCIDCSGFEEPTSTATEEEDSSKQEGDIDSQGNSTSASSTERNEKVIEHVLKRITTEASNGKSCGILRANIIGLRFMQKNAVTMNTTCPETRAALVVQAAWRGFVFRHAFLHLREIVSQFAACSPRTALQMLNPREAALADAASGIVLRFRLAIDDSCLLPFVVYKVFTRRPVVDVCRGCCGKLLKCLSGRAAWSVPNTPCPREASPDYRPSSACCTLFASYRRVDNNAWRPCSVGLLFDATLCPARVRRWLSPPWSGNALRPVARGSSKKRTFVSAADRERQKKITLLRRLYGYEKNEDLCCPPPTATSKMNSAGIPEDVPEVDAVVAPESTVSDSDERPASETCKTDKTKEDIGDRGTCSTAPPDPMRSPMLQAGDAYYSLLLSAWDP